MKTNLERVKETIDAAQIREYMNGSDIKKKLAHMKIDRVLKAFFDDMTLEGKDAALALEYLQKGLDRDVVGSVMFDVILSRGAEYVELIERTKNPATRMSALKTLTERNMA